MGESQPPEIIIFNPDGLETFYKQVLGWDALVRNPDTDQWVIQERKSRDGVERFSVIKIVKDGETESDEAPEPEGKIETSNYMWTFDVDNLDEAVERVVTYGGHLDEKISPLLVGGLGKQAFCWDPQGNMFGLFQPL